MENRLDNRAPGLLWLIVATAMWMWLARDQITITFCATVTVPYTYTLYREFRGRPEASFLQHVVVLVGFIACLEGALTAFQLGATYMYETTYMNVLRNGTLALFAALAWFSVSAYAEGYKALAVTRACMAAFLVAWLSMLVAFYPLMVEGPKELYQYIFLSAPPTLALILNILFSKKIAVLVNGGLM